MNYRPEEWDEFNIEKQADLIAYNQIREHEETEKDIEFFTNIAKAMGAM